ncbi:MAG: flagellar biosynthesis protein FlhB [Phycisphaerales bacterium]|nr:flagellar biosynthesis protein FlhB [Phycisphaerales bacterium]
MAWDEAAERTEKPTARRRSEARDQGKIARSTDLAAAVGLLAALLLLNMLGPGIVNTLLSLARHLGEPPALQPQDLTPWVMHCIDAVWRCLLPFLLILAVLAALAGLGQTGLYFSWKRLAPKFSGLNPLSGVKRLFSKDNAVRFAFSLLKMGVVAAVGWWTISADAGLILTAGQSGAVGVLHATSALTYKLALRMGIALLIIGVADYFWQRYSMERGLMMTRQEVKDEMKNMEGDPAIKARIRRTQYKMALQRLRSDVPKADVVVTNPTHFAVALRYDDATMGAPRVVAKGADFLAQRIRELAREHGVPIVERPALARALYATVDVGSEVPPALYRTVAELLAYVYRLSGRAARAGQPAGAAR